MKLPIQPDKYDRSTEQQRSGIIERELQGKLTDAPVDGSGYVRKNGVWTEVKSAAFDDDWTDLRFPVQGVNPAGTASPPTVITSLTGLTGMLEFSGSAENIIAGVAQLPHEWKRGSAIKPHIHWTKPTGSSNAVTWEFYYRIVGNPDDVVGAWSSAQTASNTVGDPTVSNAHLLTAFPDIDMAGYIESACILWRLHRRGDTDAESNSAVLYELDFHYQKEKAGTPDAIPVE